MTAPASTYVQSRERLLAETEQLSRLLVRRGTLASDVVGNITDATLDMGTDMVTELAVTLVDPGLRLFSRGLFVKGATADYGPLALSVAGVGVTGGPAGTGQVEMQLRSRGVVALRARRGPLVLRSVSPTVFVEVESKAAGLLVIAQPSASRPSVARDLPNATAEGGADEASSWSTFQRLAEQLGYICFEALGTVYFGKPSWLVSRLPTVNVIWGGEDGENLGKTREVVASDVSVAEQRGMVVTNGLPECRRSTDSANAIEVSFEVNYYDAELFRPGRAIRLYGVPQFYARYLITKVTYPIAGGGVVQVSAVSSTDPVPQPEQAEAKTGLSGGATGAATSGGGGSAKQSGTKSALDFVNAALTQSGDRYVFGAEVNLADADPDAFDCSELVQWAAARVGVNVPDGSQNQRRFCKKISVDQAVKTRGALLFTSGHVAISLGNGRTIEARNHKVGVGQFTAASIHFIDGGLVPGLRYG